MEIDLSELKPSTKTITLRLPESLLAALKKLAHQKDVSYQSLMKIFLAERVKKRIRSYLITNSHTKIIITNDKITLWSKILL